MKTLQDELRAYADMVAERIHGPLLPDSVKLCRTAAHALDECQRQRNDYKVAAETYEQIAGQTRTQLGDSIARIVELLRQRDRARAAYDTALSELLKLGNHV